MTTDAHANLTGTDLHENKGVAAASDDTVATAASGLTVWQKLTAANLTGTGNPFGAQLLHVRDEQTLGTAAQSMSNGGWRTKVLNTVKTNEISGASLASNQITLAAGTYFVDVTQSATGLGSSSVLARLYNTTDSAAILYSLCIAFGNTTAVGMLLIKGRFTLTGTKALELQLFPQGLPVNAGFPSNITTEVYSDVLIWKVA